MVKTIGSVDLKVRKSRNDIGKHRKKYAGKPIKGKRHKSFPKKIGNKTHVKWWVWEIKAKTKEQRLMIPRHLRPTIHPFNCYPKRVHLIDVRNGITKQDVCDFMEMNYWAGEFYIMGFTRTKQTRTGVKPVKMCKIFIRETEDGLFARMMNNFRMGRYFYWVKD